MKGLVVWAQSSCRSTMALYRALENALGVPVVVAVWHYEMAPGCKDIRQAVGFRADEFADVKTISVGENSAQGLRVLDEHRGWHHLFCVYQSSANFRRLQLEAARRGERIAIGSEAPCNMFPGWRRIAKEIYFRTKLPYVVRDVVQVSEFFVNYSGNDDRYARLIGWSQDKIIPFGYFPPPIPGSHCVRRENNHPFEILATGVITWHRGCDILIDALRILKERGIAYHATITQNGPMKAMLEAKARHWGLPVNFAGFMSLSDLNKAYETCSVYVGAGRHEPWGMRLNDALNCGAPLVVSRGMGGVKMVDDYGCGLAFENENAFDLADKLELLATNSSFYEKCASQALQAAQAIQPESMARKLAEILRDRGFA